jgi:plasmid stability protein
MAVSRNPCYTDPVANLTLAIDDDVLRRARIRALEQGTSVNAVVREYLEVYAGLDRNRGLLGDLVDLANTVDSGKDGSGREWTRDELYRGR